MLPFSAIDREIPDTDDAVNPIPTDKDQLRAEALRTYKEYGRIKQLYRQDRNNTQYAEQLRALRGRYEKLQETLQHNGNGSPASAAPLNLNIETPVTSAFLQAPRVVQESWTVSARTWLRWARLGVSLIVLAVVLTILGVIASGRLTFYKVPTSSMSPALLPEDHLIAYPSAEYLRGEIVVSDDPTEEGAYLVKRVVALAGDEVEVTQGRLYVNGVPIGEPYLAETMDYKLNPLRVADGEVFLLGDNRNHSDDSHLWGRGVAAEAIRGKVRYVYKPAPRRGAPNHAVSAFAQVP